MSRPSVHNVADLLTRTVARNPDRPALVTDEKTITWSDVDAMVSRMAAGLQKQGVGVGSPVAVVLPTSVEFIVAYLAILRAGGIAVPLNTEYTAGELARLLGRTGVAGVVTGPPGDVAVRQAVAGIADALTDAPDDLDLASVPWVAVTSSPLPGELTYDDLAHTDGVPVPHERGGEDVAVMLFTSGSSSDPRAALLSHRALVSNLDQLMELEPPAVTADDVLLAVLPLFHVYGLNSVLGQAIVSGASLVLGRFDTERTLATIAEHGVTVVPAAPPMLVAWSERDDLAHALAGVRYVVSGAAPLPVAVIEAVTEASGVTIHQGYGLTEAAPVVSSTLADETPKAGSVGRPLPGTEVMLVDESGAPVDEGDPGEVVVRGPNLFSGYWPGDVDGPDPEGWWRTGDVAYTDADGDLFLVDRIKDLVIVNGFNVYPREVEEVLLDHPGIAQAAVLSVPDKRTGEAVKAVVVAEPGYGLTVEDVTAHCRQRLARFKRPSSIDVVDELPRTATGKIAKGRLRDMAVRESDKIRAGLR